MIKICAYCGKEIPEERKTCNRVKYCSEACMRKANRNKTARQKQYAKDRTRERNRYYSDLLFRYDYACAVCGWSIYTEELAKRSFGLEIHHIIPVSNGGESTTDNLIVLCPNHHKEAHAGLLSKEMLRALQVSDDEAAAKLEKLEAEIAERLWKYYHNQEDKDGET